MKTLIIYDSKGKILMSQTGNYEVPASIGFVESDIPESYYAASVDTETGKPVLAEIPKTEEQKKIEALEAKVQALSDTQEFQEDCIAEMAGVVYAE